MSPMRSLGSLLLLGLLPAALAYCKSPEDDLSPPTSEQHAETDQPFEAGSVCAHACADTTKDEDWAVCWSCKCKQAMGGWLPSPDEISCGGANSHENEIFSAEADPDSPDAPPTLKQVTTKVDKCFNPDRLRNDCTPGSRLVQVEHGDVYGKAICKRE